MSLGNCIPGLVEAGKLTAKQGEQAQAAYERHYRRLSRDMGPVAAASEASEAALRELDAAARQKKRLALLQTAVRLEIATRLLPQYKGRKGKFDMGRAAEALLVRDDRAPYANVEYREKWRRNQALTLMNGVLAKHSRNLLGSVRDKAGLRDIVRELFGESTGNAAAREFAKAWTEAAEQLRRQFNAAGGSIGKIERWGLPQSHDAASVARAGKAAWKAFILPKLDPARMIDERTGAAFTPETLDKALDDIFETIRTDGAARRNPGGGGPGMVANRRQEHRFLVFKSANDWLDYAEQFGTAGNAFDAMMGHVHGMARDTAQMEILGPNPAATVNWLKDLVVDEALKSAGAGTDAVARAEQSADRLDALWGDLSGANARGHRNALALAGGALRAHQVASKLGSAVVTALPTDMATSALTRAFNGLPTAKTGFDYLRMLASKGSREQAGRLGFIAEQVSSSFATQVRFLGEELSGEVSARLAEGVMRASGLNAVTEAGRAAYHRETLAHISDERGKAWGALDKRFRRMFERYGIGERGWDELRSTPTADLGGAPWILPENIKSGPVRDRLMEMIYSETDMAVVTAGVRARAAMSGFKRGTWQGEIVRSLFQFKTFPIATLYLHGARMLAQEGWSKAGYAAAFLGLTTVAGYFAMQGKEVLKGRDPRPMEASTLFAAMQQGGGLGIYGDFLFSTRNRFNQSLSSTLLGPSASTVDALSGLVAGTPLLAAEGEDVDYDRQLVRMLRSEVPGGSLWYLRLGMERLLLDQWQAAADPNYYESWSRMEARAAEQGQGYWWRPGATAPEGLPDVANAWEGEVPE